METLSASQALQWNVEFEKALRSSEPGTKIEAILKMGPRLRRWSEETCAISSINLRLYDVDPDQDIAFANSMLLRLAEAFRTGDNFTRVCVLKAFLCEFKGRSCAKHGKTYSGVLTREKVPNHAEMLRRVKEVVDNGDATAKALGLRMIGCLADFAKDKFDILRMILEAMDSPHEDVVYAAIFTAECLCECSKGFSSIILEKAVTMVDAIKTKPMIKAKVIQLFAKMSCSSTTALSAQEAGKKLMLKLPTDQIVASTLLSLSKLAFSSAVTLTDQVELLLSYLTSDPRYSVRLISLRCIYRLSAKIISCTPLHKRLLTDLICVLKDDLPISLHCAAIWILQKAMHYLIFSVDACQIQELVSIVEFSCLHPGWLKRKAALALLVDLTVNIEKLETDKNSESSKRIISDDDLRHLNTSGVRIQNVDVRLPLRTAFLVFDQIALALKTFSEFKFSCKETECDHSFDLKSSTSLTRASFLCNLVLKLTEGSCTLRLTILDCIKGIFDAILKMEVLQKNKHLKENIANDPSRTMMTGEFILNVNQQELENTNEHNSNLTELLVSLCHCLLTCLHKLDISEHAADALVCDQIQHIANSIEKLNCCKLLLHSMIHALFRAHYAISFGKAFPKALEDGQSISNDKSQRFRSYLCILRDDRWANHEQFSIGVITSMIKANKFWMAYKIGMIVASQGAWIAACRVFEQLFNKVNSESCYFWLRSLALLSESEKSLYAALLSSHELGSLSAYDFSLESDPQHCGKLLLNLDGNVFTRFSEVIGAVLELNYATGSSLSAAVTSEFSFEFQRWFIRLRERLLKNVADVLGLINSNSYELKIYSENIEANPNFEGVSPSIHGHHLKRLKSLKPSFIFISHQFQKLARSFDLLRSSFMDIDSKSFCCISTLALHCSLLAFCCLFLIHFPKLHTSKFQSSLNSDGLDVHLARAVIQDLVQRLPQDDCQTFKELDLFQRHVVGMKNVSYTLVPFCEYGHKKRTIATFCSLSISYVLKLQKQIEIANHEHDFLCILQRGLTILSSILLDWIHLPWQLPRYYFNTRARIGVKLFASRMDRNVSDGLFVQCGCQLPLSLKVQVRNSSCHPFTVKKVFCILYALPRENSCHETVEPYFDEPFEQLEVTQELWIKMRMTSKKTDYVAAHINECSIFNATSGSSTQRVKVFVTFSIDNKGQGFATCLLDVSSFPSGAYETSTVFGCVDNRGWFWNLPSIDSGPGFIVTP